MPQLVAHSPGQNYTVHFITVEREPRVVLKDRLISLVKDIFPVRKIVAVDEVSETGYHHSHAVVLTMTPQRWVRAMQRIQAELGVWKKGSRISVRFHHPRRGNLADFDTVASYILQSKWKVKILDDSPIIEIEEDRLGLMYRGLCANHGKLRNCAHCSQAVREEAPEWFGTPAVWKFFAEIEPLSEHKARYERLRVRLNKCVIGTAPVGFSTCT